LHEDLRSSVHFFQKKRDVGIRTEVEYPGDLTQTREGDRIALGLKSIMLRVIRESHLGPKLGRKNNRIIGEREGARS
jgi:hypothetical protein